MFFGHRNRRQKAFFPTNVMRKPALILMALAAWAFFSVQIQAGDPAEGKVDLQLPTANDSLFSGHPELFFQPTISGRAFSGMYGFVRSTEPEPPKFFNKFHEGIDIQPLSRDANGEPLDIVRASLKGEVVYINLRPDKSNYGRYVVIRHRFPDGDGYTIYGHLASVSASVGQEVKQGDPLGVLGYSGNVESKAFAHVHLEFCFLINRSWPQWFEKYGKTGPTDVNDHGLYNGNNLNGVNPVSLLKAAREGHPLSLSEILAQEEPYFTARIPAKREYFDWQKRFPQTVEGGLMRSPPAGWEVTFSRNGTPLRFKRLATPVKTAVLSGFDFSRSEQDSISNLVKRTGNTAELTPYGKAWISSIMYLP